jgi:hypothetical protein
MMKQKVVAGEEIKTKKRSLSNDRRLNTSRGKVTSPSPNKKNSWREKEEKEDKTTTKTKDQPVIPKGPVPRKSVGAATVVAP